MNNVKTSSSLIGSGLMIAKITDMFSRRLDLASLSKEDDRIKAAINE